MSVFAELVSETRKRFEEHGYGGAIEVHLTQEQAVHAGMEEEVARAVIATALLPESKDPQLALPEERLFAVLDGVRVFVRQT